MAISRKAISYMLNGKAMLILLTVGVIKKALYKQVNIFQSQNILEEE